MKHSLKDGLIVHEIEESDVKDNETELIENKKWEETENEIRHRVREPELFKEGSFRYVTLKKDKPRVRAVMGKLKDEDVMKIQALRFPKGDGWTMAEAKAWVKAHPDVTKTIEEEEIIMGIDDLEEMVASLKEKFTVDFEAQMKLCLESMTTTLRTAAEDMVTRMTEVIDAELEKRKEKEVEEVVGIEKQNEVITETHDTDGVLDVFKAITVEMENAFSKV